MTMELRDGRFVKRIFFTELKILGPNAGDLMGYVYRDEHGGDGCWHFEYRFRYYEDEHTGIEHASKDRKHWFHVTGHPGADPSEILPAIQMVFERAGRGSYEEVLIESASAQVQIKRLSEQPWAHMGAPMTDEEYDAFKKSR